MGVDSPLPVQRAAVPLVLQGRNVAVKSCAGSGKVRWVEMLLRESGCMSRALTRSVVTKEAGEHSRARGRCGGCLR